MKKEFSILSQFMIIAVMVAVFSGVGLPIKNPAINIETWETEISILKYWVYSFIGLSVIRYGVFSCVFHKAFVETNKSHLKVFLSELAKTFQYFIIAVFSTFGAFWLYLESISSPGISYSLLSLWDGIHEFSLEWLTIFFVLSLLRLGIHLIWKYLSHNNKTPRLKVFI